MASAGQRLSSVLGHLNPSSSESSGKAKLLQKNADDIVITYAGRTPLTKAKKGGLKDTQIDDLLISLLTSVRENMNIDPSLIEDVCLGNVLAPSPGYVARSSILAAGFPASSAASVANRFCSSGLLAIQNISNQITAGAIEVGLAVGAESMSTCPDNGAPPASAKVISHALASQNQQPMGQTSENVAGDFNISREAMDEFAARSFQRAEKAQKEGWTRDEIVPVEVSFTDPKTGVMTQRIINADDGIRAGTTAESLGKIRVAFPQWKPSQTTGGNASQITDGAAAVVLMKRSKAAELGVKVLGKFVQATVVGLEPRIMGIGPALAIPKVLGKVGLHRDDVDVFEINEAFASMGVYCINKLGLDPEKVNPRGGAIALGHPLGCTGTRQVVTALSELRRQDKRIAVTSMCVGTGQGMAAVFVSEH
ncbi:putative peroxisomal 3-ketoacyl-CoA thiolase [Leptodontidium sp. MPI-SDFR-AT-0119]|nr:putative peroxisomal 3-ketoacyl-CoA thiolase [Leptodontidium sp. MPI-SDFR-AT-0119]